MFYSQSLRNTSSPQGPRTPPDQLATTLFWWIGQREMPYLKMGWLVKFAPVKLEEWINQQTVMPMPKRSA